jgi:hypothetical protein
MGKMVAQAYDETVSEALDHGHTPETAHREGITAAAMLLAALGNIDDSVAIREVEALNLHID